MFYQQRPVLRRKKKNRSIKSRKLVANLSVPDSSTISFFRIKVCGLQFLANFIAVFLFSTNILAVSIAHVCCFSVFICIFLLQFLGFGRLSLDGFAVSSGISVLLIRL